MDTNAAIFDLDGVLVDTAEAHSASWCQVAQQIGVLLHPADLNSLRGIARSRALDAICKMSPRNVGHEDRTRLLEEKGRLFRLELARMGSSILVPGVADLLRELRAAGVRVGVASASRHARLMLWQSGLMAHVDVVSDGDFDGQPKPAPDQLLAVARDLAVDPCRCVVIEDAEAGIQAAKRAGMKCVGVGPIVQALEGIDGRAESLRSVTAGWVLGFLSGRNTPPPVTGASAVRALQSSDLPAVLRAVESFDRTLVPIAEHDLRQHLARTGPPNSEYLVMEADEGVVGLIGLHDDPDPAASTVVWLVWLFVLTDAQGRGYGTRLLDAALAAGAARKARKAYLDLGSPNVQRAAFHLYMRRGFRVEGHLRDYFSPGDDKWILAVDLNPNEKSGYLGRPRRTEGEAP